MHENVVWVLTCSGLGIVVAVVLFLVVRHLDTGDWPAEETYAEEEAEG